MSRGIEINFRMSAKQAVAWEHLQDPSISFVGYGGSAYSGKSYLECYWITIMSIAYPGTRWGLARRELSVLRKTTLFTLFKVFTECNIIPDRDYKYNAQQNIITFTNGSVIFLIDTAHQPSDPLYTRFGGLELTGCAIDESAETDEKAIDILYTRIGRCLNHEYKIGKTMLETFNPDKGHVYRRYYKPWKEEKMKPSYRFVKALPQDNPSPDVEDYIKGIMTNASKETVQRLIFGNFEYSDDPSALLKYDDIVDLFSNTHVKGGSKYVSADIARMGGDRIVIIEWDGLRGKVSAYSKQKLDITLAQIEAARHRRGCGHSDVIVDADGMGSGIEDFGNFRGFINGSRPLPDPAKRYVDGKQLPENFDNLKSQCAFRMAELISNKLVYLECSEEHRGLIIEELEQWKEKSVDSDLKRGLIPKDRVKELLGRSPDFSDAILMRAWFELRQRFEVIAA